VVPSGEGRPARRHL